MTLLAVPAGASRGVTELYRRCGTAPRSWAAGNRRHPAGTHTPELVRILREHIDTSGLAPDCRILSSDRGHIVASTAISDVTPSGRSPGRSVATLNGDDFDS